MEREPAAAGESVVAFLREACVPVDGASHASGTLERAEAIRAAHPDLAERDLFAAAALGDDEALRRHLSRAPGAAAAKGGPHDWDALTTLCFSRYLRLDHARSEAFVRAARALLEAGADPRAGWWDRSHRPEPEWECALYGAAGVAHHAGITRLLLEHGADPNDGEVVYHAPETYDNAALEVLVESGRLTPDSLTTMLIRKADWHDLAGVRWLLEHGADPNRFGRWGGTALHQAVRRDNRTAIVEAMLGHGADPALESAGGPALALAARRGRGDLLDLFRHHGARELDGADRLLAACALDDGEAIRTLAAREPQQVRELLAQGGSRLAEFAGVDNAAGVRRLLDLGVPVTAPYAEGDPYFGVPPGSAALHVAAWRAAHDAVRLLIARGAAVDAPDPRGLTPLALAVRACVDSYWSARRSAESVEALLAAGVSPAGISLPTGYDEVDERLRRARG